MSKIRINSISIKNYRSFGPEVQEFDFTRATDKRLPLAIVGYNNVGKTNLMNAIRYALYESVNEDTWDLKDFYDCKLENLPSLDIKYNIGIKNHPITNKIMEELKTGITKLEMDQGKLKVNQGFSNNKWTIKNFTNIFYINFHEIKDQLNIQKSSWGNIKSFLGKHIKKLVDEDDLMESRKDQFKIDVETATNTVLKETSLDNFIKSIKTNYCQNLRGNDCKVEFGLPDYEDIFLQMMFKIGLNRESENLVPISHFGDGYISMFVMSVIQAIAEENDEDKCLFLFEEPESFLHENHQEYFYKTVLCELAEKGHQVIYTTHSDKMVDVLKPDSLIRLKFDEEKKQTVKTFPNQNIGENPLDKIEKIEFENEEMPISEYNSYIKNIEPNLNKILFSEKVVLVEGPNDLLVYKYLIEKKAGEKADIDKKIKNKSPEEKEKWSKAYLNFHNFAIIPHHGKSTAYLLANLCKYLGIDYFLINDWDFESFELTKEQVSIFDSEYELKKDTIYTLQPNSHKKGTVTTNWKLIKSAKSDQIHFNIPKLEGLIGWTGNEDKNSAKIWKAIQTKFPTTNEINKDIFPQGLVDFLELEKINIT